MNLLPPTTDPLRTDGVAIDFLVAGDGDLGANANVEVLPGEPAKLAPPPGRLGGTCVKLRLFLETREIPTHRANPGFACAHVCPRFEALGLVKNGVA